MVGGPTLSASSCISFTELTSCSPKQQISNASERFTRDFYFWVPSKSPLWPLGHQPSAGPGGCGVTSRIEEMRRLCWVLRMPHPGPDRPSPASPGVFCHRTPRPYLIGNEDGQRQQKDGQKQHNQARAIGPQALPAGGHGVDQLGLPEPQSPGAEELKDQTDGTASRWPGQAYIKPVEC